MSDEIAAAVKQAQILETAMKKATTDKGLSFRSLNSELQKAGTTATEMVATLAKAGPAFAGSLDSFLTAFATADRSLISISSKLKEMQRVMTQSIKFTAAAQIQQFVYGQVQEAISWVRELNSELNTIAIASGKSAEEMNKVFESVIKNSKELRVAADDYAYAAQIFYQQGLGDEEVERRSQITIKAAQAAGQSTQEMSQQLTAVWNTYNMQGEQLERAASVGARMGAETAVEFKDIATAMQISASAAAQMNVEYDMLASIIATVGDTTQQSASVIGNAYKTIFSRFDQLVSTGTDGEVTLGRVSQQLSDLGVKILDANGDLIPLGETILDLGNRWETYSQKQQIALAEAIGGTRQLGQVLALFNNWDKFMENYESAQSEVGSETLEEQYLTSLDSLDSAMTNSAEAWGRAFSNIFQEDMLKGFYNGLEDIGNTVGTILESFGGLPGILAIIGAYLSRNILTAAVKVRNEFKTWKDSLTFENQLLSADRQLTDMKAKVESVHFNGQTSATASQQSIINNSYDQQKLDLTGQITQATIKLNSIEKNGTTETKNKVQWLREALATSQQLGLEAVNNLKIVQQDAKQQEVIVQGMRNRAKVLRELASKQNDPTESIKTSFEANTLEKQADLMEDMLNIQQAISRVDNDGVTAFSEAVGKMGDDLVSFNPEFETFGEELKTLSQNIQNDGLNGFVDNMGTYALELDAIIDSIDGTDAASVRLRNSLTQYRSQIQNVISSQQQLRTALQDTTNFAGQIDAAFKLAGTSAAQFGQTLLTAFSNAAMLGMQLSALWNTLSSGEASFGAIAIQIGLLLPSLIATGAQFIALYKSLTAALTTLGAETLATKANEKAKEDLTRATNELAAAEERLKNAQKNGASQQTIDAAKNEVQAKMRQKEAAQKNWNDIVGKTAANSSKKDLLKGGLSGLKQGAAQGLQKVVSLLTKIPPQAAIAVAAVAAVTAAAVFAYNEWKNVQPEAQLKKAKEAAKGLAEAAAAAKEEADNLRTSIESYDSAVTTLKECERGTVEWNEALVAANQSALELINTLADANINIEGLYERNEDGLLAINSARLEEAQAQLDQQAMGASFASAAGRARVNEAQRNVQGRDIARDISGVSSDFWSGVGAFMGNALVPGPNIFDSNADIQNKIDRYLDDLLAADGPEEFQKAMLKAGIEVTNFNADIQDIQNAVQEYGASLNNASQQLEAAAKATVDSMIGDDYNDEVKDLLGESVARRQEKLDDYYLAAFDSFSKADPFEESNALYNDMIQAYRDYMGDQSIEAADNFARGTDTNRTFGFMIDGELKEVRAEEMASIMASQEALEGLASSAENLNNILVKLGRTAEGENIKNVMLEGNMNTATSGELIQNFDGGIMQDYFGAEMSAGFFETWDYLKQAFGSTKEISAAAKEMGMGLFEFIRYIQDGVNASIDTMQELGKDMGETARTIFEGIDVSNIDIGGQEAIAEAVSSTYRSSGKESANYLSEIFKEAGDDAGEVAKIINSIDWTQNDAMYQVNQALEEQGIYLNTSTDAWRNYSFAAREAAIATQDVNDRLETFKQNLKDFKDVTSDIEFGTVISDEDYQNLVEYNEALSEFFIQTTDGWKMISEDTAGFQSQAAGVVGSLSEMKDELKDFNRIGSMMDFSEDGGRAGNYWDRYDSEGNKKDTLTLATQSNNLAGRERFAGAPIDAAFEYFGLDKGAFEEATQYIIDKQNEIKEGTITEEDLAEDTYYQDALADMELFYDKAAQMGEQYSAGMFEETRAEEMWVDAMVSSINELGGALASGAISAETYNKTFASVVQKQAEMYDLDYEDVVDQANALADAYELDAEAASELAIQNQRMNKGVSTLSENWEDWQKILKKADKTNMDYIDTVQETTKAIADLVGTSEDLELSEEFFDSAENMELLGKAAEGDAKAINELGTVVAQDLVKQIEDIPEEGVSLTIDTGEIINISQDQFNTARSNVLAGLQTLRTAIANGSIGIGDPLSNALGNTTVDWATDLNTMAMATQMSVQEMNDILSSAGVQANVTVAHVPTKVEVPEYTTEETVEKTGGGILSDFGLVPATYRKTSKTYISGHKKMDSYIDVAQIDMGEDGQSPDIKYIGGGSVAPSSVSTPTTSGNGGGGGSKFKPEEHVDEQDKVHERYENLTEALEDMTRQLDRFSDAADDAWGAARIRQLRGYNAQIQQIARTQKQLIEETKEYYKIDKNTLMADANIASMALWNPGEYGSLANPEDIRRWIDEEIAVATAGINAEIDAYNARGVDDQDALDKAKEPYEDRIEYLEGLNEDLDQMLETTDLLQDRLDEQMQNIYDWMANKVEEMEYKLEFKLRIDESDFDRLENLLDRLGDTGIILGDSFETLSDMMSNIMTEQAPAVFEAIDRGWQIANNIVTPENQDYFEGLFGPEVWQEYLDNNGGLPAEIMEFLQDQKDALYDMIDQVVDLALEQLDAIFTKMEQWFEKYARLTDQLDVAVTKMDTLQEILDFKGTNYLTEGGRQVQRRLNEERMNAAGTQAKIAKSQLEQAKQWAATVEAEYNTMKEAYDNASDEEKSALAGGVNELYQQMIEAQEQVTDFEGEFAESISEIFSTAQDVLEQEKEMAKANISATIGGLFSDIDEMMNMYSAVDSWSNTHLDDYDKNYLLGDLQSQFDEATENINVDSYEGLAQWQEQLNKYKEDGRDVTQEEVDLLQKALDLEIARANFEDAQNAKNTMRLARDASGNWSYIYSQDQTSSNQADEIARLEYEYKKAYEEMQDSFGENIMDMAGQMKNVIENINYQLYFSSEQYRKMIDTQLDMLSQQMIASGATIEQVTSIMGTGIKNWQYDFSQSAAGIVTDTQTMEEMIDKFLVALVGTSEGYIPGNTSSGGFYGDWMTAQKDVAQVVNEKGEEIGEKFGLIQEDIGGYIDEIVAGEQGSLHYLKIETQTTQEFMDTYLGYMENDWSDTEDYLMGQIGEKGDTQQGTITGDIHQIDQAAEEMRNDTLGEFDGLLTGLQNWGVNFRSEVQTWIDKLEEYINKIKEAEIASEKKMDDESYVNEEVNKVETQEPAKPSAPSNTEDSSTAKAAAAYENAMEIYNKINRGLYPNGGANRRAKALSEGYTETEYEIAQELINKVYPVAKRGQGIQWDTAVAQIKAKYFASGGLADYTGPAWLDGSYSKPELVLNPEDTQNILSTVKLMREAVAQKIAALNGRNISGAELKSFADKAQTIEQQVHIEASFPNVSVAAEIEQAFNDLINQVAQYNIKK